MTQDMGASDKSDRAAAASQSNPQAVSSIASIPSADAAELHQFRLHALCELMSDISEDCWCAGWIMGNEMSLYGMAFHDTPSRYGMAEVRAKDINRLRELAVLTGSWFFWDGDQVQTAIPLAEFEARYAKAMEARQASPE